MRRRGRRPQPHRNTRYGRRPGQRLPSRPSTGGQLQEPALRTPRTFSSRPSDSSSALSYQTWRRKNIQLLDPRRAALLPVRHRDALGPVVATVRGSSRNVRRSPPPEGRQSLPAEEAICTSPAPTALSSTPPT